MNESKKKSGKAINPDAAIATEKKAAAPVKIKATSFTDKEIAAAIGESVPASKKQFREKEVKTPTTRKFKTHSEKKNFKKQEGGKK